MKKIRVSLTANPYDILIGSGLISRTGKLLTRLRLGKDAYVITNKKIPSAYAGALRKSLSDAGISCRFSFVPDSEKSKSIAIAQKVITDISRYDKKKQLFIIAFGGGVIGDLAGFIASVYRRGIPYIQIPTTLLAQIDSAIGGKTGVDLSEGKNLIGAFYQPKLVLADTDLLKSLPARQVRCGLAEMIKYAVIADPQLFTYLEKNMQKILHLDTKALALTISRCAAIKANVVRRDEKETRGIRTILNFGHTIGHAIETASRYSRYNHGEAISIGMVAAAAISNDLGYCTEETFRKIIALIAKAGLPTVVRGIRLAEILKTHYHDKKFIGKKNRFVLVSGIGRVTVREGIPLASIEKALKETGAK